MPLLKLKSSSVQNAIPSISQLVIGELAYNSYDGRLFGKTFDGTTNEIVELTTDTIKITRGGGANSIALADTNISIGKSNFVSNTTGIRNISIGVDNLDLNSTGSRNISIGSGTSIVSNANNNVHIGDFNSRLNTSGSSNVVIGYNCGNDNTIGSNNVVIGSSVSFGGNNFTNSIVIGGNGAIGLGSNQTVIGNISTIRTKLWGKLSLDYTINTTAATTVTMNKPAGRVRLSSGSVLTVNNTFVTASTFVFVTFASANGGNRIISSVITANGSFTVTLSGAVTNTDLNFLVIGTD